MKSFGEGILENAETRASKQETGIKTRETEHEECKANEISSSLGSSAEKEEVKPSDNLKREASPIENNPIPEIVYSFLKSRDDNLVLLTFLVLRSAMTTQNISQELLAFSNILLKKNSRLRNHDKGAKIKELVSILLKALEYEPPFRLASCLVICKLICQIVGADPAQKASPHPKMDFQNLSKFSQIYSNRIQNIVKLVEAPRYLKFLLVFFEEELRNKENHEHPLFYRHPIEERMSYRILMPISEESNGDIDLSMRQSDGEAEVTRREIKLFLMFRALRYALISTTNLSKEQRDIVEAYNVFEKENMKGFDLREGLEIPKNSGLPLVECELIDSGIGTASPTKKKGKKAFYAKIFDFFCILEPTPVKESLRVSTILKLKSTEVHSDQSDPRKLIVKSQKKVKSLLELC